MTNPIIAQLKEIEAEQQELIDRAREDAMQQAKDAIETLKALGIHYQIVAKNSKRPIPTESRKRTRSKKQDKITTPDTNENTDPPQPDLSLEPSQTSEEQPETTTTKEQQSSSLLPWRSNQ